MSRYVSLLLGLSAFWAAGCDASSAIPAGSDDRPGPHKGILIALPHAHGFAEIVDEKSGGARAGRTPPSRILVYLLDPELKGPATVSASNASVTLTLVTGTPESVELQSTPEATDPLGKNRLASRPGVYPLRDAEGELVLKLDGQEFRIAFDGGRLGR